MLHLVVVQAGGRPAHVAREHQMVPLNLLPRAVLSLAGEQMCMLNGSIAQHVSSVVVQQQQQHVAREHQMVPLNLLPHCWRRVLLVSRCAC